MDNERLRAIFIDELASKVYYESPIKVPLINIGTGNNSSVVPLNGTLQLPPDDMYEVDIADLALASIFFPDIIPLWEGETGIGKSVLSDVIFTSLFGLEGENWTTIRLGGQGVTMNSDPYTPFYHQVNHDSPKFQVVDPERTRKFYAIFVDEPNRGETDKMLQILDRKIRQGDKPYKLGVPFDASKGNGPLIPPILFGAQNPNNSNYLVGTMDIAAENRMLLVPVKNTLQQQSKDDYRMTPEKQEQMQESFWSSVVAKASAEDGKFKKTKDDWAEIYADIRSVNGIDSHFSWEAADAILGYVGNDPEVEFNNNKRIIESASSKKFTLEFKRDDKTDQIKDLVSRLRYPFVGRDVNDLADLSRLFGFIRGYKTSTHEYSVTLSEIAAAFAMVTQSKFETSNVDISQYVPHISDAIVSYGNFKKKFNIDGAVNEEFFKTALDAGIKKGYSSFIGTLEKGFDEIYDNCKGSKGVDVVVQSRMLADLSLVKHFFAKYQERTTEILKSSEQADIVLRSLQQLYFEKAPNSAAYDRMRFIYRIKV